MLHIVRHGRTKINAEGRLLGRENPGLDEVGREQAENVSKLLGEVDLVISSPLARAIETAEYISSDIKVDERWIELDYGNFEGVHPKEIDPDVWIKWRNDIAWAPPGGESLLSLGERVRKACGEIIKEAKQSEIVVVTHVSPIKAALAWSLDVGDSIAWRCYVSPGSLMSIAIEKNTPSLKSFNRL